MRPHKETHTTNSYNRTPQRIVTAGQKNRIRKEATKNQLHSAFTGLQKVEGPRLVAGALLNDLLLRGRRPHSAQGAESSGVTEVMPFVARSTIAAAYNISDVLAAGSA